MSSLTNIPNYIIKESKGIIYSKYNYDIYTSLNELKNQAYSKGCNAVINIHICTKENFFFAYGDAIIIQKINDDIVAAPSLTEKPK